MKILLIEDDSKIASLIHKGLEEYSYEVTICHDGESGLETALAGGFDVAIVDIMLPKRDGLSVIEQMRFAEVQTPVLILSAKQSVDDRILGLQRGGDDYMIKPFAMGELIVRIQALIRRNTQGSKPTTLKLADLEVNLLSGQVVRAGKILDLPSKEYSLLKYMLQNKGITLSKTSILKTVYGYNFDPQTNVVDVLVCRLRNKIDKEFTFPLIHTVRGVGYVIRDKE